MHLGLVKDADIKNATKQPGQPGEETVNEVAVGWDSITIAESDNV